MTAGIEEKVLLNAASRFARVKGVPMTKMAWALSSVMGMPENSVLHRLQDVEQDLDVDQSMEAVRRKLEEENESDVVRAEDLEKRVGDIVDVEALSVRTYGVVCKVRGTTRTLLLHLSEIADAFISDIAEYVETGDTFQAMLIVNRKGELGLSTRRFKPLERKDRPQDMDGVVDTEPVD